MPTLVKIATLDNPGCTVTINLEETDLEENAFPARTSTAARTTGCGRGPPKRSFTPGVAPPTSPGPSRCSAPGRSQNFLSSRTAAGDSLFC
ncbi:Imm53 family immunity protein [Streptomyces canus]|uniref:Imm53 family immunity protein n=1 Tax=Streptomyces canus TaxID=58343 RepID=UPI003F5417E6